MEDQRYPIGIQSFPKIINQGYTYVDKTGYIKRLLKHGQYIFLSRPRRFGKSLLLSTLEAFFKGHRELFKGLAADSIDFDWTPSPVLRFDFNSENFSLENGLELLLDGLLRDYEEIYGRRPEDDTPAQRFRSLIRAAFNKTERKVIILVDEYDKPLLEIEDDPEKLEKNLKILKSFFGNLKSMDDYIEFAFITGVARFNKVSIFSDLNNLKDISMDNEYADICGWTEQELIDYFRPGIEQLSQEREEDFDTTLLAMRNYYDGYLFTPKGSRLYNPFSVLNALASKEIDQFWFETGTPTFLAKRVKALGISPMSMDNVLATKEELVTVGFDLNNPVPLMFQTGYLTIGKAYTKENLYELRFPNKEVELGFFKNLLPLYVPATGMMGNPFEFTQFKKDLLIGDIHNFMERLSSLFKDLPGEDHSESTYRAITYMLTLLCGTQSIAEHHGYKGRSDIEVITQRYIYVFEFKYNRSVTEAMNQIYSRDYAGRYGVDHRKVFLIAANYVEKKEDRKLEYKIEEIK
ncbi:MAG: ATP-binding protein [Muribaculaceae bacterium]|nr:ATP-binding protein [Muribaculaceae bacterium]